MAARQLSNSFGAIVRTRRAGLSLTQEEVAERASIHPTYVGMVERGERNCSLDVAHAIAAAVEVPLSQLIAEAEAASEAKPRATSRRARLR